MDMSSWPRLALTHEGSHEYHAEAGEADDEGNRIATTDAVAVTPAAVAATPAAAAAAATAAAAAARLTDCAPNAVRHSVTELCLVCL